MNTALLIIDVQQALCTGDEAAYEIDLVIERINALSAKARAAHVPVIFVQHEEAEGPLRPDGEGWQLADGLVTLPEEPRIRKKTPDSFHKTTLEDVLKERRIGHLIICGLQSDCCIDSTVRRALALGYDVTLVEDAHSTMGNGILTAPQIIAHHNLLLKYMNSFGPRMQALKAADIGLIT